jgi:hypothetical protein
MTVVNTATEFKCEELPVPVLKLRYASCKRDVGRVAAGPFWCSRAATLRRFS